MRDEIEPLKEISELIKSMFLPAPEIGEYNTTAWPKIRDALKLLIQEAQLGRALLAATKDIADMNLRHLWRDTSPRWGLGEAEWNAIVVSHSRYLDFLEQQEP